MEEKRMSPILIVVLSVLGTCLVGFGIWYGVNHFKGGEEPSIPNDPIIGPSTKSLSIKDISDLIEQSDNDNCYCGNETEHKWCKCIEINGNKLEFKYSLNYLESSELINNIKTGAKTESLAPECSERYNPCMFSTCGKGDFSLKDIINDNVEKDNVIIDSFFCYNPGIGMKENGEIIVGKDKYLYYLNLNSEKFQKVLYRKVKNINSVKTGDNYNISVEFED